MFMRIAFFCSFLLSLVLRSEAANIRLKLPCGEQDMLNPYRITVFRKAKEVLHTSASEFELKPGTYRLQVRISPQQRVDTLITIQGEKPLELDLSAHPLLLYSENRLRTMLHTGGSLRISCLVQRCHGGPLLYTGKLQYNAADKRISGLLTDLETHEQYAMDIGTGELMDCFAAGREASSFSSGSYILLRTEESTLLSAACFPLLAPQP